MSKQTGLWIDSLTPIFIIMHVKIKQIGLRTDSLTLIFVAMHVKTKQIQSPCQPKRPLEADGQLTKTEHMLAADLQKADGEESEAVGADAAREHLIHVPLQQELLQNQHQVLQRWVLLQEFLHTHKNSFCQRSPLKKIQGTHFDYSVKMLNEFEKKL